MIAAIWVATDPQRIGGLLGVAALDPAVAGRAADYWAAVNDPVAKYLGGEGLDAAIDRCSLPIPASVSAGRAVAEAVRRVADAPGDCPLASARSID
jgi:hypothetical protein